MLLGQASHVAKHGEPGKGHGSEGGEEVEPVAQSVTEAPFTAATTWLLYLWE